MSSPTPSKTDPGNFFEDFTVGQVIEHATPRTITEGDRSLYGALYPSRFAIASSAEFAAACGLAPAPVEELTGAPQAVVRRRRVADPDPEQCT